MINFGAFGMPNVGAHMCNFATNITDEELCARYFQLSIVSPLAFYSDRQKDLKHHPFNFKEEARKSILISMITRMEYLMYMRSQLRHIELFGGSLLRPLFAEFDSTKLSDDI
jgi:alpha-glucosidase (family GH31 glycosyl hydrolase)